MAHLLKHVACGTDCEPCEDECFYEAARCPAEPEGDSVFVACSEANKDIIFEHNDVCYFTESDPEELSSAPGSVVVPSNFHDTCSECIDSCWRVANLCREQSGSDYPSQAWVGCGYSPGDKVRVEGGGCYIVGSATTDDPSNPRSVLGVFDECDNCVNIGCSCGLSGGMTDCPEIINLFVQYGAIATYQSGFCEDNCTLESSWSNSFALASGSGGQCGGNNCCWGVPSIPPSTPISVSVVGGSCEYHSGTATMSVGSITLVRCQLSFVNEHGVQEPFWRLRQSVVHNPESWRVCPASGTFNAGGPCRDSPCSAELLENVEEGCYEEKIEEFGCPPTLSATSNNSLSGGTGTLVSCTGTVTVETS